MAQRVKNPPACGRPEFSPWFRKIPWRRAWQPTRVFLPGETPLTEEPGGLQSMRSQRVRHNWATKHSTAHIYTYIWMHTLVNTHTILIHDIQNRNRNSNYLTELLRGSMNISVWAQCLTYVLSKKITTILTILLTILYYDCFSKLEDNLECYIVTYLLLRRNPLLPSIPNV